MKKILALVLLVTMSLIITSCELLCSCKGNSPGLAVAKVYIADDGIPQVNISELYVYPGQNVLFEGLDEFSLLFDIDPENPRQNNKEFKSKSGMIKFKISSEFEGMFDENNRQSQTASQNPSYFERAIRIKYAIESNGRVRDPLLIVK